MSFREALDVVRPEYVAFGSGAGALLVNSLSTNVCVSPILLC